MEVVWEELPDGSARVTPVPDIMSLLGSAQTGKARDPGEKGKARLGWAEGSEKGRAKR